MAATEPNNPRDDGCKVCDATEVQPLSGNHAVSAKTMTIRLCAFGYLAHGLRNSKSQEQRLLQLRSESSFTVCAPEAGLQKLQHLAGPCA